MDLTEPYLSESSEACLLVSSSQVEETQYAEYVPSNIFNSLATLRKEGSINNKEDTCKELDATPTSEAELDGNRAVTLTGLSGTIGNRNAGIGQGGEMSTSGCGDDDQMERNTRDNENDRGINSVEDEEIKSEEKSDVEIQDGHPVGLRAAQACNYSPGSTLIQNIVEATQSEAEGDHISTILAAETDSREDELGVPFQNGHYNGTPHAISETESGGISDAPTAVVSDTEGHGQVFVKKTPLAMKPRTPGSPEKSSSTVTTSNLSSFSSSSSDERDWNRKNSKQKSKGNFGSLASEEQSNVHKTTWKQEQVFMAEKYGKQVDHHGEDEVENQSNSQEDLFPCSQNTNQRVATPSEYMGSLQFSQHEVLAMDTLESDSQSVNYIPPSPGAYGSVPVIIPSSPTALSDDETETATGLDLSLANLSSLQKIRHSRSRSLEQNPVADALDTTLISTLDENHRRVVSRCQTDKSKGSSASGESYRHDSGNIGHCPSSFPVDIVSMDDGQEESIIVLQQKEYVMEPTLREDAVTPDSQCPRKPNQTGKSNTPRKLFENDMTVATKKLQTDIRGEIPNTRINNQHECRVQTKHGMSKNNESSADSKKEIVASQPSLVAGNSGFDRGVILEQHHQGKRYGAKQHTDNIVHVQVAEGSNREIQDSGHQHEAVSYSDRKSSHIGKFALTESVHLHLSATERKDIYEQSMVESLPENCPVYKSAREEDASITILEEESRPSAIQGCHDVAAETAEDWSLHLTPSQGSTSQYTLALSEATRGANPREVRKKKDRPCIKDTPKHYLSEESKKSNRPTSAMSTSSEASGAFRLSMPEILPDTPDVQRHEDEEQVGQQSQKVSDLSSKVNARQKERILAERKPEGPTLTLNMIHTQSENSEDVTEFMVERPDIGSNSVSSNHSVETPVSMFTRVKEAVISGGHATCPRSTTLSESELDLFAYVSQDSPHQQQMSVPRSDQLRSRQRREQDCDGAQGTVQKTNQAPVLQEEQKRDDTEDQQCTKISSEKSHSPLKSSAELTATGEFKVQKTDYSRETKSKSQGQRKRRFRKRHKDKPELRHVNAERYDTSHVVVTGDSNSKSQSRLYDCETQSYDWQKELAEQNQNNQSDTQQDTQIIEDNQLNVHDPFEFRMSQSQRDRQSLKSLTLGREARKRKATALQKEEQTFSNSVSTKRKSGAKGKSESIAGSHFNKTQARQRPRSQDVKEGQDDVSQGNSNQNGREAQGRKRPHSEAGPSKDGSSGEQQGQGDGNKEKPPIQGGTDEPPQKIIRTVVEEIVTVRRIITEEIVIGGRVVKKTTREEKEEPVVRSSPGSMSTISPSRTVSSLTSGDLGDVSSLSKTTSISTTGGSSLSKSASNVTSPSSGRESPSRFGSRENRSAGMLQPPQPPQTSSKNDNEDNTQGDGNIQPGIVSASGNQTRAKSVASNQTGGHEGDDELTQQISSGVVSLDHDRAPSADLLPSHVHTPVTDERTGSLQRTVDSFLSPAPPRPSPTETVILDRTHSSEKSLNKSSSSSAASLKHSESLFTSPELAQRQNIEKQTSNSSEIIQAGQRNSSSSSAKCSQSLFTSPELKKKSSTASTSTTSTSTVMSERGESIDDTVFTKPQADTVRKKQLSIKDTETSIAKDNIVHAEASENTLSPVKVSERPKRFSSSSGNSGSKTDDGLTRRSNRKGTISGQSKMPTKQDVQRKEIPEEPESRSQIRDSSTSPVIPLQSLLESGSRSSALRPDLLDTNIPGSEFEGGHRTLETGTNVLARWKDGFFYPGVFISVEKNGKYLVYFDDEDQRQVKAADLIVNPELPVGLSVMALSVDGYFDSAIICEVDQRKDQTHYLVELDDGKKKRLTKSSIILSVDQAALLPCVNRPETCPPPATAAAHLGDVSLDNLIEGKRKRSSKTGEQSAVAGTATEPADTSTSTNSSKGKQLASQGKKGQKRKFSHLEPKATSTPTPKRMASRLIEEEHPGTSRSNMEIETEFDLFANVEQSPVTVRRSPRKARAGLFTDGKGPIPPPGSTLFQGYAFLLTNVDKSENEKKAERKFLQQGLDSSTDDSSIEEEEEEVVPFDKCHLRAQIEGGGGVVLDKFNPSQIHAAQQVCLISSAHQRTIKYLQCLAACIPCVSHVWIRDSCRSSQLLDHKAYLLPAGINIESKRLVEWNPRNDALMGMSALLVSSNKDFQLTWTSVLEAAGCQVTAKMPGQVLKSSFKDEISVVVTDSRCPKKVITMSSDFGLPVVSTEWVIQSLISGQRMNYCGHVKYKYNYEETI
ncbi:uncharacterized protein LOC106167315 isoform X2 [Lingula anatina]|uniref:Uncharacterized protein LOC106167315 isoform X2 n=1 Tax=Lingula anatina TaxID=7574 RepID=A0A1S3IUF6_LINAN|nr:uncharacterized protein LOC106167315 isoform X2 [Lingula anatina]|eukprot:XP_013401840.1 uncharacterized protein LOC106167315 isoform X2 [Lingula anatina]